MWIPRRIPAETDESMNEIKARFVRLVEAAGIESAAVSTDRVLEHVANDANMLANSDRSSVELPSEPRGSRVDPCPGTNLRSGAHKWRYHQPTRRVRCVRLGCGAQRMTPHPAQGDEAAR